MKVKHKNILKKNREIAWQLLMALNKWFEETGYRSVDWYDIWSLKYGRWAKNLFFRTKIAGSLALIPLIFLDYFFPQIRKFFFRKRTFPICHAHIGLGYLNLYRFTKEPKWLIKAESFVEPILKMASPMAKGLGWGMKHDWMTNIGLIPQDTPCHTQTSYVYEFFRQLHRETGEVKLRKIIEKIAYHEANDFKEWMIKGGLCSSYSMLDERRVINANTYRAYVLIDSGIFLNKQDYLTKGIEILHYIINSQNPDGSWFYGENPHDRFIDHYHTCFVLKNLIKCSNLLRNSELSEKLKDAIDKGKKYYFGHLFDRKGYPVMFSIKPRFHPYKYDSYDLAECIGLLSDIGGYDDKIFKLLKFTIRKFQTEDGWFKFRTYICNLPYKGIPYMRYANSAMFLSLSKILKG